MWLVSEALVCAATDERRFYRIWSVLVQEPLKKMWKGDAEGMVCTLDNIMW